MDPITIALIGAALGAGKGFMDQDNEDKQRKIAAVTARWSPWTGMQAQLPKGSNILGSVLQGAMAGAMMGKQFGGGGAEAGLKAPQLSASDYTGTTGQSLGYMNEYGQTVGYDPFLQGRLA